MLKIASNYRISDPYVRFHLKVMEPNMGAILEGAFDQVPLSTMPVLDSHLGLQFEAMLLQNCPLLLQMLQMLQKLQKLQKLQMVGFSLIDIVRSGPYSQMKNTTQLGRQIDYRT